MGEGGGDGSVGRGSPTRYFSNFSFTRILCFYGSDPLRNEGKVLYFCVAIFGFHPNGFGGLGQEYPLAVRESMTFRAILCNQPHSCNYISGHIDHFLSFFTPFGGRDKIHDSCLRKEGASFLKRLDK